VFCEQWYGPFRNGDQLGGCAIRDSAFASSAALEKSNVTGIWKSRVALADFQSSQNVSVILYNPSLKSAKIQLTFKLRSRHLMDLVSHTL